MNGIRWSEEELATHERKLRGAVPPTTNAGKPSKYRNTAVTVDGRLFDSRREADRWRDLRWRAVAGQIVDLEHHRTISVHVNGVWICDVEVDFSYRETAAGLVIVEDVKPEFKTEAIEKRYKRTDAYRRFALKKRLMLAVHGIDVREV